MPYNAKERVSLHNNWRLTLDMITLLMLPDDYFPPSTQLFFLYI